MEKGKKNIRYGKNFKYTNNEQEYVFKLRKRNWWWLLLLLLPLLLLLKCECKGDADGPVIVHVTDIDTKEDIAGASVTCTVNSLFSSAPTHNGITDENGRDTLHNVTLRDRVKLTITARAEGYADTTYTRVRIPRDLEDDSTVNIKMRPLNDDYHADIVMCIDNTGSMESLINMVKTNAMNFHSDLKNHCAKKGQSVNDIRIRVIVFGDLIDAQFTESGMLDIPRQQARLHQFINDISLTGGGDEPEDGMEALAMAINTPWEKKATRRRHIIIIYTDASAHNIGTNASSPHYPKGMPSTMAELTKLWDGMDHKARRLVLFAPDKPSWNQLEKNWNNVIHEKEDLNSVLSGKDYYRILEAISKSL